MKRTIANLMYSLFAVVMIAGMSTVDSLSQTARGAGRLTGTWDAVVTIRDCNTGNALNSFRSIANFNQGGTFLGSTSGLPQSARTPEHGVWRHVMGNLYEFKFKSFNFDPTGNAVTYTVVRHDLELDQSGDAYTSAGEAKVYLMNGVQVGQGCSSGVGTRFDF